MEKKLQDYLHYYIGSQWQVIQQSGEFETGTYNTDYFNSQLLRELSLQNVIIKPILRRLEDMTEDEMIGLLQSMTPADMEDKPTDEDYNLEMFYNDDGLMVDNDIAVGANFTCICFDGQIGIKKCGSIILFEEDKDVTRDQLINAPMAFHYLLSKGFDLFGLIDAGLAIDSKTLTP